MEGVINFDDIMRKKRMDKLIQELEDNDYEVFEYDLYNDSEVELFSEILSLLMAICNGPRYDEIHVDFTGDSYTFTDKDSNPIELEECAIIEEIEDFDYFDDDDESFIIDLMISDLMSLCPGKIIINGGKDKFNESDIEIFELIFGEENVIIK